MLNKKYFDNRVPNGEYALISKMCLTTHEYGITLVLEFIIIQYKCKKCKGKLSNCMKNKDKQNM